MPCASQPHFANSLGVMKFIFKLLGNDPKYERWRWQMFALTWLGYAAVGIFPALLEYLGLKCPARLNRILPTRWVS